SFNSPIGMCLDCDGLGAKIDFAEDLRVPDPEKSFYSGAVEIVGPLKGMGRWRKHIFNGIAEAKEIDLKQPWKKLTKQEKQWLLYGIHEPIICEWRARGGFIWRHAEKWDGIIPDLVASYKKVAGGPRKAQLEKYMRTVVCPCCNG